MSRKTRYTAMMNAARESAANDIKQVSSSVADRIENIELDKIYINPTQHRKYFSPEEQEKLRKSIELNGFQGAVLLRYLPKPMQAQLSKDYEYELVFGESRYRAVKSLEWDAIPAIAKELSDREVHRLRLDENLVRKDLNPIEEMSGLLEVAADELDLQTDEILSILDEVENATRRDIELKGDVALQAKKLQSLLDYYNKGTLAGFRTKYRKLQKLPADIKKAVEKSLDWSKAVEIAPIKDPSERSKALKWAIQQNPSIKEIRKKRKEIKAKTATKADQNSGNEIKVRLYQALKNAKNSDVWNDSKKVKKIEKLTVEFESIFGIEV